MKKNKNIKLLVAIIALSMPQIAFASKYIVCDGDKKIPYTLVSMVATVITIIKIAVPILLVISGMVAFFKVAASTNVDDEMKKAKSKLINNIIAAVIVFFAFSIVNFAVSLVAGANSSLMKCAQCFLTPEKCNTTEVNDKLCPGFLDGEYDENCKPIKKESENKKTTTTDEQKETNETPKTQSTNTDNNANTSVPAGPKTANSEKYINGILIVNKTYSIPRDFGPASAKGTNGECTDERCFTNQTWQAWVNMQNGARLAGIKLRIGSGYRSYDYQAQIYNNYVARDGKAEADRYSARPGHSEHQTGLAMDICSEDANKACIDNGFDSTEEAKWLSENAYKYGFILRYPNGKESITGYQYESWHFRYVGKTLAEKLYNNGNWTTLEEYLNITSVYQ